MADNHNVTEMATLLATVMSEDLDDEVLTADVLDWLASAGLTLRPDEGDATIAYQLVLEDETDRRGGQ